AAAACEPGGDDAVPALRHREHGRVLEAADEFGGGAQVRVGFGGLREEDAVVLVQRLPAVLALEGEVHAVGDVGVVGLLLGGGGAVVGGQRRRLVLRQQRDVEGLRHGRLGRALAGDLDG